MKDTSSASFPKVQCAQVCEGGVTESVYFSMGVAQFFASFKDETRQELVCSHIWYAL